MKRIMIATVLALSLGLSAAAAPAASAEQAAPADSSVAGSGTDTKMATRDMATQGQAPQHGTVKVAE